MHPDHLAFHRLQKGRIGRIFAVVHRGGETRRRQDQSDGGGE
jgi:hypothetical protein